MVLPTLFRRVHSLEPHLFSFSLFCPFQCGLVNVSKCSEFRRLKEGLIVTVCSRGFDFPDGTYGKYHGIFIRIMTEIIPTISTQDLRKWRYFICYDSIELWLYRLSSCQCSQSLPIQMGFRPVSHFLFSLLSLHSPVTGFEFKCNFQDRIQESSYK